MTAFPFNERAARLHGSRLRRDEEHRYFYDGQRVPGVTSLIEQVHPFTGVHPEVLRAAQDRGDYVHRMCQYLDEDDFDQESCWPEYRGYMHAWLRFTRECRPQWHGVEPMLYHPTLGFAGQPDRLGTLNGKPDLCVPDIKTGEQTLRVWGIQNAAYRALAAVVDPEYMLARRFTIQLRNDGTYKLHEHTGPLDWPAFSALLTLHTWATRKP